MSDTHGLSIFGNIKSSASVTGTVCRERTFYNPTTTQNIPSCSEHTCTMDTFGIRPQRVNQRGTSSQMRTFKEQSGQLQFGSDHPHLSSATKELFNVG